MWSCDFVFYIIIHMWYDKHFTCGKHIHSNHTLVYFGSSHVNSVIHMWMTLCHMWFCVRFVWLFSPNTLGNYSSICVYYVIFMWSLVTYKCISDAHTGFTGDSHNFTWKKNTFTFPEGRCHCFSAWVHLNEFNQSINQAISQSNILKTVRG